MVSGASWTAGLFRPEAKYQCGLPGLRRSLLHDALRLSARRRLRRERYEILTISVNVNYSSYSNGLCSALHLLIVHADRRAM